MDKSAKLHEAVENLYAVFAAYPLRDNTEPFPCCHSSHDEQRIHAKPLRKLDADDLREFASDVLHVWGGVEDFKHFLPRIFELEILCGDEFVDPQVAFGKLRHSEWTTWPEVERHAIHHIFNVLWGSILDAAPPEWHETQIEDWLCGIALAEGRVSPYLEDWLERKTDVADLNLASFITRTGFASANRQPTAYWSDVPELFEQVSAWVRGGAVKTRIKMVADRHPECGFAERAYTYLP